MFQAIIGRAQHSIESAVSKYVMRVFVALPFLIGLGFGIAAASTVLIENYGYATAYLMLAGAFVVVGIVALAAIAATNGQSAGDSFAVPPDAATQASDEPINPMISPDMLVATLGIVGPKIIPAIPLLLRFVVKNWALIVSIALVTYLLMAEQKKGDKIANPDFNP